MAIITLTTDWNRHDYYAGLIKGNLLKLIHGVTIVELSHQISPFHVNQAAFVLRHAIRSFPPETIHLLLVNQVNNPGQWPVIIKYHSQYILGWDDGIPDLIMDDDPEVFFVADKDFLTMLFSGAGQDPNINFLKPSFPELQIFPLIASYLIKGGVLSSTERELKRETRRQPLLPTVQNDLITGQVVYIDSYHNAISNISKDLFVRNRRNRRFDILVKSNHYRISSVQESYYGTEPGELLALFNSVDLLEIAIMMGKAAELLALEPGSTIKVKFYDE